MTPDNNNVGNKEKEVYLFINKDSSDKVISSLVIKIICKQLWNLRSNSKMYFLENNKYNFSQMPFMCAAEPLLSSQIGVRTWLLNRGWPLNRGLS